MKALLVAALCATAFAQDINVYGTMPEPYQILKWDTAAGTISPVGKPMEGLFPSPELSAVDYRNMVYYNMVYDVQHHIGIQLIGVSLINGSITTQAVIPFQSGARIGHGESVCVDHSTGTVYVAGPITSDYSTIGWFSFNPYTQAIKQVAKISNELTREWWGSSSTFDSRRNTIWTMGIFNTSGHIEYDFIAVNLTTNAVTTAAMPTGRFFASLSYDFYSDRIYSSAVQAVSGVLTHFIASFTPSLTMTGWRQANTTGFQPLSMIVAFAHHDTLPPVLYSLALPLGVKPGPNAGPFYIAGFQADTGAFLNSHFACRSIMQCPISIEVTEPYNNATKAA